MSDYQSLNDKLEAYLRQRAGEWIDGRELACDFGTYAWRSRVSDVRSRLRGSGYDIENRQRRITRADGRQKYTISEYRLTYDGTNTWCLTAPDAVTGEGVER